MSLAVLVLGGLAFLGGAGVIACARSARRRLAGLALMAAGSTAALLSVMEVDAASGVAAVLAGATLVVLVLVARHLENLGRRDGGGDLDLELDPGR